MRALIINRKLTSIMQAADVFEGGKVLYQDLDLGYKYEEDGKEIEVTDEMELYAFAWMEFKENLILLCGKDKPLYINPNVQTISTGEKWTRLIDVVKKLYPNLEFETDEHLTNIKIKELVTV